MAKLYYNGDGTGAFPAGYCVTFNSTGEAVAQATEDIRQGRQPEPSRVEDDDGKIVADRDQLQQAAKA